jgi:hypothetical protein
MTRAWNGDSINYVDITASDNATCVNVKTSEGFYLCTPEDVDEFADLIKSKLNALLDADWCMGNL